jgi:hypothetical protein
VIAIADDIATDCGLLDDFLDDYFLGAPSYDFFVWSGYLLRNFGYC